MWENTYFYCMSRLSIDLSSEQHQKIKALAVLEGKSIKDLVLDKVFDGSTASDKAMEELLLLLDQRLTRANQGSVSTRTPHDIAKAVLERNTKS